MSDDDATLRARCANTTDGPSDPYVHAISLHDATLPQTDPADASRSSSPNNLAKRTTVTSVRERLARRKYAKWTQAKFSSGNPQTDTDDDAIEPRSSNAGTGIPQTVVTEGGDRPAETETIDRGRKCLPGTEKKRKNKHEERPYEVDILYENQRGLFFFGIPLYSHSSLLNFDPAPWVTKDLKDSPVNITNAQVPDPSWEWAWKSWYVDMSYDVDEEGWQYSFSFGRKWVWHGTHPWFHSYARRRRWLRKRVKCQKTSPSGGDGSVHAAHLLTSDYFTIHPKGDRSPTSTVAITNRESYTGQHAPTEDAPESIDNIASLLKSLRLATIDREKIDSVKKFLCQGGEELASLKDQIPEIMSLFMFQTSRRQLLELLQCEAAVAQKHRDEHSAEDRPEGIAESRRIDNLLKAMRAAKDQIGELEYWSDRKNVLQFSGEAGSPMESKLDFRTFDGASIAPTEDNHVEETNPISEKAEAEVDPNSPTIHPAPGQARAATAKEKGKGRAEEITKDEKNNDYKSFNVREASARRTTDSLLVPDQEREVD